MSLLAVNSRPTPPSISESCFLWHLPTELLLLIADELDQESLRTLSQVCRRLSQIAATRYLANSRFEDTADNDWRMIEDKDCEAVLVWRRTDLFKIPKVIWFLGSNWTDNHQFHALTIFFDSLWGLGSAYQVHLCFYKGPTQGSLALFSCLESILRSGCQDLRCYGGPYLAKWTTFNGSDTPCANNLRELRIDSPLLFILSLHNAPLQRLTLTGSALTADNLTKLFASLVLPQLTVLEVGAKCPLPILVKFLLKHQVRNLHIASSDDSVMVRSPARLRPWPRPLVPSLAVLDGPAEVITKLMRLIDVPEPLEQLIIQLRALKNQHILLLELLDCAEKFAKIEELWIMVENDINDDKTVYAVLDDGHTCSAKCVVIHLKSLRADPYIIGYCVPWMQAFAKAQTLWLHTCSFLSNDELEGLFRAFSPLKDDLWVYVLRRNTEE